MQSKSCNIVEIPSLCLIHLQRKYMKAATATVQITTTTVITTFFLLLVPISKTNIICTFKLFRRKVNGKRTGMTMYLTLNVEDEEKDPTRHLKIPGYQLIL